MRFNRKKIIRYTLISVVSIILLVTGLVFSLQIPSVQNFVKDKLIHYLEERIQTKVSLERMYVGFPNSLVMENLFLEGKDIDTLLYVKSFDVGLDIPKLLQRKVNLTSIDLEKIRANVVRDKNGTFNFDYIIDAFATDEEEETDSKPFVINLNKIKLKDIDVSFIDKQAGNDLRIYFNSLDTRVNKFDLDENTYAMGDIKMDGLNLKLKQELVKEITEKVGEKVDSLNQAKPLNLSLQKLKLTNFTIDYGDDNSQTYAKVLFKDLETQIKKIDLAKNHYEVDRLILKDADILANLYVKEDANEAVQKEVEEFNPNLKEQENENLFLLLNKLRFENVKVEYNNTAIAATQRGMDFNHLNFSTLNIDVDAFKMENSAFSGKVKKVEIKEKSGLNIQDLRTDFVYNDHQAILDDLYLETPTTILRDKIQLDYHSMEQLTEDLGSVKVFANLKNSKVGFSDILLLAPDLRNTSPFSTYPNAILAIDTKLEGRVDDLDIDHFTLSGLDQLKVNLNGKIKNATDPDRLYYDLNIKELAASSKTIYNLVPKGTLPNTIHLPSQIQIQGTAKGTTEIVQTKLKINTSLGNADLDADVNMTRKNHETYTVQADFKNLQIGKIIQNRELGSVTGKLYAKGESFDPEVMNTEFKANLNSFGYQNYTYHNVDVKGNINHGDYYITADSKDPNADLNLVASGHYDDKKPTIQIDGDIQKLDLFKLGFYEKHMMIAGKINANFTNINPDELNGELRLNDFAISDSKDVFPLQEIQLIALNTADENRIDLTSQVADVHLSGKYKLTQIFDSLLETLNTYYAFSPSQKKAEIDSGQYFVLDATIKGDDLIRKFAPELKDFQTITINGSFNADSRKIELDGELPFIQYGENSIEKGTFSVTNFNDELQYNLNVNSLKNESFALNKIEIKGDVKDNVLGYDISTRNEEDKIQFLLAGNLKSMDEINEISLNPNGLVLNFEDWKVNPDNRIQISDKGIFVDNFKISKGNSQISLQSENQNFNSPLNINIDNFEIETLTKLIESDSLLASGRINGKVQVRDIQKNMNLDADLKISELMVFGNPVGNLTAKVNSDSYQLMNANIELTGNNNQANAVGTFNSKTSQFDMNIAIDQLQMESIQGFTMNNLMDSEGYLSGKLQVSGTTDSPKIKGKLNFNQVGFTIKETGSKFKNINDPILFTDRGLEFHNFEIQDLDANAIVIDGQILTQTYTDFVFNLDVNAKNFKLIDSEEDREAMMFGKLAIDADLAIRGDLDLPKVNGGLKVTENTDFTFVLPQSTPQLQARDGIVEFIDQSHPQLTIDEEADKLSSQSKISGLDVSVNIEVVKEAKMSIVIDKANGDFVKLQGEAELTGGIDPSGKMNLTGIYAVEKGSYELTVSLLKRKFDIQKGSTITWTGDPLSAVLDLTAIYKTNAAPIDLVQQQISGLSSAEVNMYKQQIPFNTLLILKGELMKPEISFKITTDEDNHSVSSDVLDNVKMKLNQLETDEAERNKQVFALLLLNRFVGENPFETEGGLSAETMARQSVSAILSQQLNNLAADLIQGVDIDFGLDSRDDYTSGQKNTRTDLNLNVSKRLLNDRLKITVGSNFGIEGDARENEEMTNIAGDISIDYRLSKDGRYTLRAYRKDEYQVALQGQIIETGVGFIITLEYDEFKEIFERKRRDRMDKMNRRMNKNIESE